MQRDAHEPPCTAAGQCTGSAGRAPHHVASPLPLLPQPLPQAPGEASEQLEREQLVCAGGRCLQGSDHLTHRISLLINTCTKTVLDGS